MHKSCKARLFITAVILPVITLTACNSNSASSSQKLRVELPQSSRLQQNNIATTFEKRVGRIAIMLEDGNISVMDQTGGNVVRITQDATRMLGGMGSPDGTFTLYNLPVWSPDAKQLALVEVTARQSTMSSTVELSPESVTIVRGAGSAVVQQDATGQQQVQRVPPGQRVEEHPDVVIIQRGSNSGKMVSSAVYVAQADGTRPLKELFLSKNQEIPYLDWSPDSSKLAFLTHDLNDAAFSVNLVNAAGGIRPQAIFTGTTAAWHWNPDSTTLVAKIGTQDGGDDQMAIFDAQSNTTQDISAKGVQSFTAPSYSPDGNFMLLTQHSDKENKLILADRNGKANKTLATFNGNIAFSWSPAGAKLAYVVQSSAGQTGGPLHMLDANTGDDKVLTQQPVVAFFWSPDGTHIATFSNMMPGSADPKFAGFNFAPPTSRSVFLLQTIDVNAITVRQLFIIEPTEAFRRMTTEFDRYARAVNIWSPDSRRLVFTLTYRNGTNNTDYVLETESSGSINPRNLSHGSLAFWSPQ